MEIDVIFTPGHSPGHVTYSVPDEEAIFSGDVLFQGSVGQDRPARRRLGDPARVDPHPGRLASARDHGLSRAHGDHDAGRRAGDQPVPGRAGPLSPPVRLAHMAERFKAPRGTFDVLPEQQPVRSRIHEVARRALEAAGYGRIETPIFEDTDLFARGVGRVHRHRPEADVHLRGSGRPLADAAAGGHRVDLPRLPRARHADARAAGEALDRRSLLPPRAPAGGPLPPVHPDRRRGDRL